MIIPKKPIGENLPLVAGGQGKSERDVVWSVFVVALAVLALAATLFAALMLQRGSGS